MVDAAFGKTVRIEVVESSVERISVVALLVRITEDAFADKCVVGLVGLVDVEVSRQDSRQILASSQLFHLFLYEESALHTGFLADVVHVLGLPVKMVTYSSSVIPIFLITLVLPYVERFVNKVVPSVVKFILRPVLTILIMAPISLCVLGPLGSIIGDGLVNVLLAIEKVCPWALPTVIGAFMPFLVMTGMHYSLLPAYVNSLSMLGYETVIGPGNLPSNIAQGAAALCVAIKTKNKNFRQLAVSGGVTALLGVTEPALFVCVSLSSPPPSAVVWVACMPV
jgi:phosphotransferase system  glucose/maltose/N-acetylglucosamine-specific IIC component